MLQLKEDAPACRMNSVGETHPARNLRAGVDPGREGIADGLGRDRGGLGDYQARVRAIAVVGHHHRRHHPVLVSAITSQRRHDDPVDKGQAAQLIEREQVYGHDNLQPWWTFHLGHSPYP